ncbi:hypothetical protein AAVH_30692 [Aphelenchoides avenae]|nr:hypothetical protein AAVH_30692 [Aphelenchus avenae]
MYFQRARLPTNVHHINLEIRNLPLWGQQLDGIRLTVNQGIVEHYEQLENGARIHLEFGWSPPLRTPEQKLESTDAFRFGLFY